MVAAIKKKLLSDIFVPERLELAFKKWSAELRNDGKQAAGEIKKLKKELADIETRQARILDELESGDFPRELLKTRLNDLDAKRKGITLQIQDLQKDMGLADIKPKTAGLREYCSIVHASILEAEGINLREKLRKLGVKIIIGNDAEIEVSPVLITGDNLSYGAGNGT